VLQLRVDTFNIPFEHAKIARWQNYNADILKMM